MSPMAVLLVLLVLSYIGSLRASGDRKRMFGSPSGIEYVVLGALLGPEALGLLGQGVMSAFEPVTIVALGWIGLLFGLECGIVAGRRAPVGRLVAGIAFTIVTTAAVTLAAYAVLGWVPLVAEVQRLPLAFALGLVSAETTRHAVRWLGERQPLAGPLSDLLVDLAAADDAPVLLALAGLFAYLTGERELLGTRIEPMELAGLTIGSGVALGVVAAWLIRRAFLPVERWTILLGAAWLATGMTKSLGLSAMAATFAFGVTLSVLGSDASRLRAQVGQTEGAVLLPALLLAGAHLELPKNEGEVLLIAVALAARMLLSFLFGLLLSLGQRDSRGLGPWLGAGMLASGTLTIIVGFGLTLRCPPEIARPVLAVAFLGTLLGEVVGPAALKQALGRSSAPPAPIATSEGAS